MGRSWCKPRWLNRVMEKPQILDAYSRSREEKGGKLVVDAMGGSTVGLMQDSTGTSSVAAAPTSNDPSSIFTNYAIISAFLAFVIAQGYKFVLHWYTEDRWDVNQLVGSGGMPSSHSATVAALAVAVGLQDGFLGSPFAVALILACVVMYDATGVRLHAGRQAEVLNQIVCELPAEHPLAESRPLRELLGHTPFQVAAGALLGLVTATIIHLIFG